MGVLPTLIHENLMWVFIVLIWILAMFYGAGFGLMPAFLTAMFGSQNIGYERAFALNLVLGVVRRPRHNKVTVTLRPTKSEVPRVKNCFKRKLQHNYVLEMAWAPKRRWARYHRA
jgi:hypothetical protein